MAKIGFQKIGQAGYVLCPEMSPALTSWMNHARDD